MVANATGVRVWGVRLYDGGATGLGRAAIDLPLTGTGGDDIRRTQGDLQGTGTENLLDIGSGGSRRLPTRNGDLLTGGRVPSEDGVEGEGVGAGGEAGQGGAAGLERAAVHLPLRAGGDHGAGKQGDLQGAYL